MELYLPLTIPLFTIYHCCIRLESAKSKEHTTVLPRAKDWANIFPTSERPFSESGESKYFMSSWRDWWIAEMGHRSSEKFRQPPGRNEIFFKKKLNAQDSTGWNSTVSTLPVLSGWRNLCGKKNCSRLPFQAARDLVWINNFFPSYQFHPVSIFPSKCYSKDYRHRYIRNL